MPPGCQTALVGRDVQGTDARPFRSGRVPARRLVLVVIDELEPWSLYFLLWRCSAFHIRMSTRPSSRTRVGYTNLVTPRPRTRESPTKSIATLNATAPLGHVRARWLGRSEGQGPARRADDEGVQQTGTLRIHRVGPDISCRCLNQKGRVTDERDANGGAVPFRRPLRRFVNTRRPPCFGARTTFAERPSMVRGELLV